MNSLFERDARSIGAIQKLRFFPGVIVGGRGVHVIDDRGSTLLDLSAAWGAASLGYSHPNLVAAVAEAVRNPAGASVLSAISQPAVELAEALLARLPDHRSHKVVFGHSGSDVIETAMRSIASARGRSRFLAFAGAYHGGTMGAMSVSGHPVQSHATRHPGLALMPYPASSNEHSGRSVIAWLEKQFAHALPASEIGACFIEPVQSDGGMLVPEVGFLHALSELCSHHGILTVCDEVKVGLGRTGRLHCFEHEGFRPDVVCFGKGLGGGLPLAALVGPADVLDHATAFAMQTLHGNPVAVAAALAVLRTIDDEGLTANAATTGAYLLGQLQALKQRHPVIADVRGRGLAIGVELDHSIAPRAAAQTVYRAWELGLVVYYVGVNSNVLELTPALNFSIANADAAVEVLDQALSDVSAGRFDQAKLDGFAGW